MLLLRLAMVGFLAAVGPGVSRAADRGEASFHVDVPPRAWRALAIKSLPAGAAVRATVTASGPLDAAFVHQRDLEAYPRGAKPLFRGRVEDRLQFSVIAPSADHYALVLDNLTGSESVAVDLKVEAARADAGPKQEPVAPADPGI